MTPAASGHEPREPIRVCMVLVHPTPYRTPILGEIAQLESVRLDVLYCETVGEARPWDLRFLGDSPAEFLPQIPVRLGGTRLNPGFSILGRLRKARYDCVIINGYVHPTMVLAILHCRSAGIAYGLLSESHLVRRRSHIQGLVKRPWVKWVVSGSTLNFAVGTYAKEYLVHYGARPESVFILPNTCDVGDFARQSAFWRTQRPVVKAQLGIEADCVILYVGRLVREKGITVLLRAFRELRRNREDVALLCVGDGRLRRSLESSIRSWELPGVRIHGWAHPHDLPRLYAVADVLVLPSVDEPWGAVVTEAMAARLPVVVTRQVGAAGDLVSDGVTGLVVAEGDPSSLCAALERLVSNPAERGAMGSRAFERVRTWDHGFGVRSFKSALEYLSGVTERTGNAK